MLLGLKLSNVALFWVLQADLLTLDMDRYLRRAAARCRPRRVDTMWLILVGEYRCHVSSTCDRLLCGRSFFLALSVRTIGLIFRALTLLKILTVVKVGCLCENSRASVEVWTSLLTQLFMLVVRNDECAG